LIKNHHIGDNLVSFADFLFCTLRIMGEQQPPPAAAQRMVGGITAARLNPFWTNSPAAWFRATKAQFMIRRVTCPLEKYYAILTALLEANVDRVRHVVEAEPTDNNLKEGLVASHVMSDYQKIVQMLQMEPLNERKPSDMLVKMEKLKPADVNQYFAYMILHHLPCEVRVLLTKEPVDNMRALAEKVDAFLALHRLQSHDMAALVAAAVLEAEEDSVAAVKNAKKSRSQGKGKRRQCHQRGSSPAEEKRSPKFGDKCKLPPLSV
jgi:hypothetical protein